MARVTLRHAGRYLSFFLLCAVSSVRSQATPVQIGEVLSEALHLAGELPGVTKPDYVAPNDIAVSKDGTKLYVTGEASRELLVVDIASSAVEHRVELPASPTGLVVSPDGAEIFVTCMSELLPVGVVAVVDAPAPEILRTFEAGHSPRSPVLNDAGTILYVCNRFANTVTAFDPSNGAVKWEAESLREPYAAALTPDNATLLVADYLVHGRTNRDTAAAVVSFIDASTGDVETRVQLTNGAQSCADIAVSHDGKYAYVSFVRSLHTMTPLNRIDVGWINANAVGIVNIEQQQLVGCFLLDDNGKGAANPRGLAVRGNTLVVVTSGTDEIHRIDLNKLHQKIAGTSGFPEHGNYNLSFSESFTKRQMVELQGTNAVTIMGDSVILVGHYSDNVGILGESEEVDLIRLGSNTSSSSQGEVPPARRGEYNFTNADQMCFQGWQSCASCHPDGRMCSLNWNMPGDGNGNFKNATSLVAAHLTAPSMWTGIRDSSEMTVRAMIRYILFWAPAQLENRARAIDTYIGSLRPFPSPALTPNGPSAAAVRGKEVFNQLSCGTCHPDSNYFTDQEIHAGRKSVQYSGPYDGNWDTPTLHEIWRTGPYSYDGSCATLKDVFLPPVNHGIEDQTITDQQLNDLVEYLKTL